MGWFNLLVKDVREHGFAMLLLGVGFILVVFLALEQQLSGAFSMSGFEVVRFSLITNVPLIAFILGNRLIVKEYIGGTRKFVEALPIKPYTPLLVKYILGLFYIITLCVLVVMIVAGTASAAEDIDKTYLQLLIIKTAAIGLLYWSVVFFVSLTGRIRLVLYVLMGLALMYFINVPSIDETRFAPLALMDRQLFVFEREIFPWGELIQTALIALGFVVAGFVLALLNEGSIAEQLGKPISRRDMVAFALLGLGCMTVYSTLQKKWETPFYELSGAQVIRVSEPVIAVSYVEDQYLTQAQRVVDSLQQVISDFKADVGIDQLPQVQVVLNTDLEKTEIEPELTDGVLVTANFIQYDDFEYDMLSSIAMHHLLLSLTNGRWDYETRHWLLDGLARWWADGGENARDSVHNDELFALALVALRRIKLSDNPLHTWQTITDNYGFEAASAMSYSALLYLEEQKGTDMIVQLAADYINEDIGSSVVESVQSKFLSDAARFENITGIEFTAFTAQWFEWLKAKESEPVVAELLAAVPRIEGEIKSVVDERGVHRLEASFSKREGYIDGVEGTCVLRHQLASAYDRETMIYTIERDRQPCKTNGVAHTIESPYAAGDRVYGLLEFESERFHRPIPLWVGRIHVK